MAASICPDELEYFIDLAMNESQRWMETVTRERFLDEDDFLYSIRYGTQLRRLLNKLRPGSFALPPSSTYSGGGDDAEYDDQNVDSGRDRTTSSDEQDDEETTRFKENRLKYTLEQHGDQDEESWILTFLRICRTILGIPPQRLFRPSDLDFTLGEKERDSSLSTELLDRIRRVIVTVAELAQLYESTRTNSISKFPRIDKSALEPLIRYHDHLWLIGQENDHCLSAYSSPRIKRTASTKRARKQGTPSTKLSRVASSPITSRIEDDDDEEGEEHKKMNGKARKDSLENEEEDDDDAELEAAMMHGERSFSQEQHPYVDQSIITNPNNQSGDMDSTRWSGPTSGQMLDNDSQSLDWSSTELKHLMRPIRRTPDLITREQYQEVIPSVTERSVDYREPLIDFDDQSKDRNYHEYSSGQRLDDYLSKVESSTSHAMNPNQAWGNGVVELERVNIMKLEYQNDHQSGLIDQPPELNYYISRSIPADSNDASRTTDGFLRADRSAFDSKAIDQEQIDHVGRSPTFESRRGIERVKVDYPKDERSKFEYLETDRLETNARGINRLDMNFRDTDRSHVDHHREAYRVEAIHQTPNRSALEYREPHRSDFAHHATVQSAVYSKAADQPLIDWQAVDPRQPQAHLATHPILEAQMVNSDFDSRLTGDRTVNEQRQFDRPISGLPTASRSQIQDTLEVRRPNISNQEERSAVGRFGFESPVADRAHLESQRTHRQNFEFSPVDRADFESAQGDRSILHFAPIDRSTNGSSGVARASAFDSSPAAQPNFETNPMVRPSIRSPSNHSSTIDSAPAYHAPLERSSNHAQSWTKIPFDEPIKPQIRSIHKPEYELTSSDHSMEANDHSRSMDSQLDWANSSSASPIIKEKPRTVRAVKEGQQQNKIHRRPSASIVAPAVSGNALKYIQAKSDLDLRARQLLEKAEENKKKRSQMRLEEQEQEWAADLENWKLKRSNSLVAVQRTKSEGGEDELMMFEREPTGGYQHQRRMIHSTSEYAMRSANSTTSEDWEEETQTRKMEMEAEESSSAAFVELASPIRTGFEEMTNVHNFPRRNTNEMNGGSSSTGITTTTTMTSSRFGRDSSLDNNHASSRTNGGIGGGSLLNGLASSNNNNNNMNNKGSEEKISTGAIIGGFKNYSTVDSSIKNDKFQSIRNVYDSSNSNISNDSVFRSRPIMKQADPSRIVPVYAKIPNAEEAAMDSGVDSYRPESLTPSRDSHESLSPGSQGSIDHHHNRKSSTDHGDYPPIRSAKNGSGTRPSWDSFETKENTETKELLITLEQKRERGDKGFGFTLKGGRHEKGEPVVIDYICSGSTAEQSRMRIGDELLEVDGMDVSKAYLAMINATISQAAKAGSVELKVRRRIVAKDSDHDSRTANGKSPSRYVLEKKSSEPIDEPSFDQKRLQFEKTSSYETSKTAVVHPSVTPRQWNNPTTAPTTATTTNRRQPDIPTHRHNSPITPYTTAANPNNSIPIDSPPPVNRSDYEMANVGQLVARYAGNAEESRFRSISNDGSFDQQQQHKSIDHDHHRRPINAAELLNEKTPSPFAERRRNPGKVSEFVPEIDRSPSSASPKAAPRRLQQSSGDASVDDSDYRVTSVHSRMSPGNILNFVPESERKIGAHQARNVLEDREEIDQRWQRERARVLGTTHTDAANPIDGKKEFYFRDSPAIRSNFDSEKLGLPTSMESRYAMRTSGQYTHPELHAGRSLSPPRVAPPPPPMDEEESARMEDRKSATSNNNNVLPSSTRRRFSNDNTSSTSSPYLGEYSSSRPYAHVRHEPIAFSQEPLPRMAKRIDQSSAITSGGDIGMQESIKLKASMFEQPDQSSKKSSSILDHHYQSPNTDAASRKLDDLLRKQQRQNTEVELQYLEMAASAAASGVDIAPYHRSKANDKDIGVQQSTQAKNDPHQHWLVREAEDLRLTEQLRSNSSNDQQSNGGRRPASAVTPQHGANRANPSTVGTRYSSASSSGGKSDHHHSPSGQEESDDQQQVLAVSAMQRCSHCEKELGRGAAMIIESLNLFFHLGCFKCYVCGMVLSDGAHGADVRVRAHKLHCQRCYSNDDAGLQFSEV